MSESLMIRKRGTTVFVDSARKNVRNLYVNVDFLLSKSPAQRYGAISGGQTPQNNVVERFRMPERSEITSWRTFLPQNGPE